MNQSVGIGNEAGLDNSLLNRRFEGKECDEHRCTVIDHRLHIRGELMLQHLLHTSALSYSWNPNGNAALEPEWLGLTNKGLHRQFQVTGELAERLVVVVV